MKKPEHFNKLKVKRPALDFFATQHAYVGGYNDALEKTNANGLYEALVKITLQFCMINFEVGNNSHAANEAYEFAELQLEKAKNQNQ